MDMLPVTVHWNYDRFIDTGFDPELIDRLPMAGIGHAYTDPSGAGVFTFLVLDEDDIEQIKVDTQDPHLNELWEDQETQKVLEAILKATRNEEQPGDLIFLFCE